MNFPTQTNTHDGLRHEIRNNLTLLSSRLQLLASKYPILKDDEIYIQLHEDINAIFTVLDYSKPGVRIKLLPCDMKALLEDLYQSCLPVFRQNSIRLFLQIPDTLPTVRADAHLIRQALINLLKNAAEASSKDQQVCLRAEVTETHLILSIIDNGTGITQDQQDHIFEPFISYKTGGTGLGLPMVKSTVYAHHGRVECHSEPGIGSTFRIALPLPSSPV